MRIANDLLGRLLKASPMSDATLPIHRFDMSAVADTIERALDSAGLNPHAGPMKGVRDTIRQALGAGTSPLATPGSARGMTIEGVAREVFGPQEGDGLTAPSARRPEPALPGQFVGRSFANEAGARSYKLYVPASYSDALAAPVPLVVMLHGCTQSPDDFAAGTRMNALAEEHGFLVVYPAQTANANGSKCWNWFRPQDQERDRGEPSLIAGITREVAKRYRVDERRIFVAGLSAGAAMAVILGTLYPDLYAAVGAHSGLPFGAAHDVPSAFAAMSGGSASRKGNGNARGVPTIVFHGDHDRTVTAGNGAAIVEQAAAAHEHPLRASTQKGAASAGRTHSRTVHADAAGRPVVEEWVLHGAGHAWSGGSADGSFTDPKGPDASAEMIRFFLSLPRAGSA